MDLSLDNLRVKMYETNKSFSNEGHVEDASGKEEIVTLVDFSEEKIKQSSNKFSRFVIQFLKSYPRAVHRLAQNSNLTNVQQKELSEQLLTKLTHGIEGFDQEWNQLALNEIFQ